jgi:hypothetical protein
MIGFDSARDLISFIINTEYRVTPQEIYEDYDKVKPIVDKITKDGRGDLLGELVKGIAITLVLHSPEAKKVANNVVKFWDDLPEENAVLLNTELERLNRGEASTYFAGLYSEMNKSKSWPKLIAKIKNVQRVK